MGILMTFIYNLCVFINWVWWVLNLNSRRFIDKKKFVQPLLPQPQYNINIEKIKVYEHGHNSKYLDIYE